MESFTYQPLRDTDEIRLLKIAPRHAGEGGGRLKDSIQHVHLSASPLYTAVSWMWGIQGDLVDIEVDDSILRVQQNLSRVIEDLRDDHQARRVWIDAISINQQDIRERNCQVQMMGTIYGSANYVVVCLNATQASAGAHSETRLSICTIVCDRGITKLRTPADSASSSDINILPAAG